MDPSERVRRHFEEGMSVASQASAKLTPLIVAAAGRMGECLLADGKILICGNGGSAAQAQHFAAAMLNRCEAERPGLPVMPLSADTCTLTSIANDKGFIEVFAKQVRALGQHGDVLFVLCTNGNSANILAAVSAAHDRLMRVVALTGDSGGLLAQRLSPGDTEIRAPTRSVARTQELHLLIVHCLCDLIDSRLFGQEAETP
jgi:D-sedoheptulose 7-phosphate isomerase